MISELKYKGELIVLSLGLLTLFGFISHFFAYYWYIYELLENIAYMHLLILALANSEKYKMIYKIIISTIIACFSVNLLFSLIMVVIKISNRFKQQSEIEDIIANYYGNYITKYSAPIFIFILVILIWKVALKKK